MKITRPNPKKRKKKFNKFGLSRYIPADIEREIRRNCGFGCVNCGSAFYQYEHIDPPFSLAKSHETENIALLCGGCHDRVTRGHLSKKTIKEKLKSPAALRKGFSFGILDSGSNIPTVILGNAIFKNIVYPLQLAGDPIFSVSMPEEEGAPININAYLADKNGKELLRIENNVWKTPSLHWDVQLIGNRLQINNAKRDIALVFRTELPDKFIVERLSMMHKGNFIESKELDSVRIITSKGIELLTQSVELSNGLIGLIVNENSILIGVCEQTVMIGGPSGRIRF